MVDSVKNLAEDARLRIASGASRAAAAQALAARVGGYAAANVAIDTAIKEGSKALGFPAEGLTLAGAAQAALVGPFVAGHGIRFQDYSPQEIGTILVKTREATARGIDPQSILTPAESEAAHAALAEIERVSNAGTVTGQPQVSVRQAQVNGRNYGVSAGRVEEDGDLPIAETSLTEPKITKNTEAPANSDRPAWLRTVDSNANDMFDSNHEITSLHLGRSREAIAALQRRGSSETGAGDGRDVTAESLLAQGTLPEFDSGAFEVGLGERENIGRNEHLVFHLPGATRVYKITKPGEYGAGGDLSNYLDRIDESNRLVNDDAWLEGALRDSATGRYRLVISQRWINDARAATPQEIEEYFRRKGYVRYSDRAFYNPTTETLINDAEPVNVLVGPDNVVYPIDIIPTHPRGARLEVIEKVIQARQDAAAE